MIRLGLTVICIVLISPLLCQQDSALIAKDTLKTVNILDKSKGAIGASRLYGIEGMMITYGKKSELINMEQAIANTATSNSRQIYARIPGLNIFENDGSGQSVGIGGRGLNPNRMSNFNTRQNGYDISADALGYPESYYTPPAEAIDRIEILRGAASLQFGTQFGGMINYRLVQPSHKNMHFKTRLSIGSFGLINTYNQLKIGNISFITNIKNIPVGAPIAIFKQTIFMHLLGIH
jgi:Fe(3+) dicitrate transport protein